jgi:hypothetical protein
MALSSKDIEQFVREGFVRIPGAIDRTFCEQQTRHAFDRLGYDPSDPDTWTEAKIHMPGSQRWKVADIAPRAWDAMKTLVGGESRIKEPEQTEWADGFILNLRYRAEEPWSPPGSEHPGWHKDGDFFYHFLDSPEQGLLCAIYWSDVAHRGGGTYIIPDSIAAVAQLLNENREGLAPGDPRWKELPGKCRDFREVTAKAGDVILMHPFLLHASSQNMLGVPRFMTNPPLQLAEPMRFDRRDPAEFSPVEQAILRSLGLERLDYTIEGERRGYVPERIKKQQRMLEEEKKRLGS